MQRLLNPVYKTLRCDLKMQKQWILGLSLINRHKSRTVLWDHRLIQIFEKVPSALWTKTTGDQSSPRGTASPCTTQNWECAPHCVIIIILWHQTNWRVKNLSWLFWGSSTLVRCWWENVGCQKPSSWAYEFLPPNYVRMPGQLSIIIATERVIFLKIWPRVEFISLSSCTILLQEFFSRPAFPLGYTQVKCSPDKVNIQVSITFW